jgi:hypothetical protein
VILVTQTRPDVLARLDVFIGGWSLEARSPDLRDHGFSVPLVALKS